MSFWKCGLHHVDFKKFVVGNWKKKINKCWYIDFKKCVVVGVVGNGKKIIE